MAFPVLVLTRRVELASYLHPTMRSTFSSLWTRRHLIGTLVISEFKHTNRGSALGLLWWFLDPLIMAAIYYVMVVVMFQRGGDNQPYLLFLVCGLFAWKAFSDTAAASVNVIRKHAAIMKAVSFPVAVLPLAHTIKDTVHFLFGLVVATGIAVAYGPSHGTWPSLVYLLLPIPVLIQMILTAGVAMLLSTLGLRFIDLQNIVRHLLRISFYASPGLYALSSVPERYRTLYMLNPFAGLLTSYREILMYGRAPEPAHLLVPLAASLVLFGIGFLTFRRQEGRLVQYL